MKGGAPYGRTWAGRTFRFLSDGAAKRTSRRDQLPLPGSTLSGFRATILGHIRVVMANG